MPVPRTSRLVMKKVCSSCASLLETNWSYCIHCGASTRRPPQHQSELDASAAPSDPYRDLDQSTLLACSNPTNNAPSPRKGRVESKTASSTQQPGRANNIRRQPRLRQDESIDVHHQLQLWRKKLWGQEHLLESLEKSNEQSHRVALMQSASDLSRAVQHGRALVRNWSPLPSSSVSTSLLLPTTDARRPRKRNPEHKPRNSKKSLDGNLSKGEYRLPRKGELCEFTTGCRKATGNSAFLGERGERREQREQRHQRQCKEGKGHISFSSTASYIRALVHTSAPPFGDSLGSSLVGNGGELPNNSTCNWEQTSGSDDKRCLRPHTNIIKKQQTGWFWGGSDICTNSKSANDEKNNTNITVVRKPGAGALGAFWRKGATRPTVAGEEGAGNRRNNGNPAFIGVASAKAANLSARNRAAELERLLFSCKHNRYSASRGECLAKAASVVRAAQIAISCANERLFELELQAGEDSAGGSNETQQGGGLNGDDRNASTSSNHVSQMIKQLAAQLEIAQSLQASAVAASANIKQLFATHDAAATLLQATARRFLARRSQQVMNIVMTAVWQDRVATEARGDNNDDNHARDRQLLPTSSPGSQDTNASGRNDGENDISAPVNPGDTTSIETPVSADPTTLPWEEGGWWTLAETEGIEETETSTSTATTIKALVKVQAALRSRLARHKTFAAVNARFEQHFDEEFQHPFYVCLETNRSQWNRPFRFGVVATPARTWKRSDTTAGVEIGEDEEEAGSRSSSSQSRTAAAVTIQCAIRAARARQRMAELIVFGHKR